MEMLNMSKSRYPGITTLSDGRKRIRLRAVDPRTGRMKEVDRVVEGTVQEAASLRTELQKQIRNDAGGDVQVPRLGDYATLWLASRIVGLKASSSSRYAEVLDTYVLPYLGDFFVDRITESDVRGWQARLARKRSGATVNGALVMLRMVLEDAVEEFDLPKNPSRRIRRLPVRRPTDEEPNLLTGAELGRVLTWLAAKEPDHHPLAATLALTGLRYGEATALKWADLDADAGIIRVRRAQWHGVVSTTKTGTSRTVPLVGDLADTLQKHRARLLACQAAGLGEGWVFPGPGGGLLRPNALRFPLRRALKGCGVTKRVSVHGLRRTFNNLARQVAGEIVTRSITGHVTAAMTEHYSHVDAREKLAAASKILLLLAPASEVGDQVGDRIDPPTSPESERATTLRTS
jgi:integrase